MGRWLAIWGTATLLYGVACTGVLPGLQPEFLLAGMAVAFLASWWQVPPVERLVLSLLVWPATWAAWLLLFMADMSCHGLRPRPVAMVEQRDLVGLLATCLTPAFVASLVPLPLVVLATVAHRAALGPRLALAALVMAAFSLEFLLSKGGHMLPYVLFGWSGGAWLITFFEGAMVLLMVPTLGLLALPARPARR